MLHARYAKSILDISWVETRLLLELNVLLCINLLRHFLFGGASELTHVTFVGEWVDLQTSVGFGICTN